MDIELAYGTSYTHNGRPASVQCRRGRPVILAPADANYPMLYHLTLTECRAAGGDAYSNFNELGFGSCWCPRPGRARVTAPWITCERLNLLGGFEEG
jgi:hypothetical protein